MREVGAIVPADTYAPDEPDLRHIRRYDVGKDLSEKDNATVMMRHGIFGRVLKNWEIFNPTRKPTLLFAPGVRESIWFAERFRAAGIRSAHIDGSDVWLDGEFHSTSQEMREKVMAMSRSGEVKVVCNRFVLREGINAPWIGCGCLATCFGALTSYLQTGGRMLRSFPGKDRAIIIDHGGNWWRHGSLDADRVWDLELTNNRVVGERQERLREKKNLDPNICSKCGATRDWGRECYLCGHINHTLSRWVVEIDGTLRRIQGDILRPRVTRQYSNTEKLWRSMYWSQRRAGRTFRQAEGWFCHKYGYWPPRTLPLMPVEEGDWWRRMDRVPTSTLRGEAA